MYVLASDCFIKLFIDLFWLVSFESSITTEFAALNFSGAKNIVYVLICDIKIKNVYYILNQEFMLIIDLKIKRKILWLIHLFFS